MCSQIAKRMEQRRQHIHNVCQQPIISENYTAVKGREFPLANVRWCLIPKCGTTFVRQVSQYMKTLEVSQSNTTSGPTVAVLRDPYERLVAGYLDKVLLRPSWFPKLGHKVMMLSGVLGKNSDWTDRCSIYATFPQFIKYFIHSERSGKARDTHFTPMSGQCDFCYNNFTYIGHLDTLYEDIDFIFRKSNISMDMSTVKFQRDTKIQKVLETEREFVDKCVDMSVA